MRKIKGQLKEIVDEMNCFKTREEQLTKANNASFLLLGATSHFTQLHLL
ncbi:hypothetical protein EST38_g14516 [Candolleomyces aberdarensis]|uniref:Uncharacterized protein n=1 Tax=Candolleomyces aberdarensis TaxID=2316362 RepID=A0A4Q2CY32_9AGAR|nr:hypothetical protein EST38_g14516 [Candolleomyces aberdarensis]